MVVIMCRHQLQIKKTTNFVNGQLTALLWKSRETGGICRCADRCAFDGSVSMIQMPSKFRGGFCRSIPVAISMREKRDDRALSL